MKRFFLCLCIITLLSSCSGNDNLDNTENLLNSNFYALTVGNSWVYKNYIYNPQTQLYEDRGIIDSISIVDLEDINGHSYYKFKRVTTGNSAPQVPLCHANGEYFEYWREFEGNLINELGTIKFTYTNFDERVVGQYEWGTIYETLMPGTTNLDVEAGMFQCINSERYAVTVDGIAANGLDRFYYSNGFGLIYDTTSFVSSNIPHVIRRLDSYNIQ